MPGDINLYIAGQWGGAEHGATSDNINPATGEVIAKVASASTSDLDRALASVAKGYKIWSRTPAVERAAIIHKAAALLRERADTIARLMTEEQGKPVGEARIEVMVSADLLDWFAEDGRREYGRVLPFRSWGAEQKVVYEPIGPVVAFTPWNFPVSQAVRKLGPALSAGCSVLFKPPAETPASPAALVKCFEDAGLPGDVLNMVYGKAAEISAYTIPHPIIRKVSFTGSVPVGKKLAALAGANMKPATMELGGHAPVLIFEDADIEATSKLLVTHKYRNAGQVCVSPTRFLVHDKIYSEFLGAFVEGASKVKVGSGLEEGTQMGPLLNENRIKAVSDLVDDAVKKGAKLELGGRRLSNAGSYYSPTVLSGVTTDM
jgi:succinate-semialdehyde dehydrogenase / glutarate-semialdehyde dehydrogenase